MELRRIAELKHIAVYAIDVPRANVAAGELEHRLGGRFPDFHAAYSRAEEEAKPDRYPTRARVGRLEFREFRNTRTILFQGRDGKLNRKLDDPGDHMATEFSHEPIVDGPVDFVVARAVGYPLVTYLYVNHAKECPEDYVTRVSRGEETLFDGTQPVPLSSLTHLAVHHLVCEVIPPCFERPAALKLLGAVLRTELPLRFNRGRAGISR